MFERCALVSDGRVLARDEIHAETLVFFAHRVVNDWQRVMIFSLLEMGVLALGVYFRDFDTQSEPWPHNMRPIYKLTLVRDLPSNRWQCLCSADNLRDGQKIYKAC